MEKIVGVAQLYFMPHPLLEIVQRLMAHPVCCYANCLENYGKYLVKLSSGCHKSLTFALLNSDIYLQLLQVSRARRRLTRYTHLQT
jgi:hypothetical protein